MELFSWYHFEISAKTIDKFQKFKWVVKFQKTLKAENRSLPIKKRHFYEKRERQCKKIDSDGIQTGMLIVTGSTLQSPLTTTPKGTILSSYKGN